MNSRSSAALVALALFRRMSAHLRSVQPLPRPAPARHRRHPRIPVLQRGFWGVVIKPVDGADAWYARNADKLMMPASVAQNRDAGGRRREARVGLSATRPSLSDPDSIRARRSSRRPDVAGSGDPSLDDWDGIATRLLVGWATQFKAAGISAIDGRIVGDDNAFEDDSDRRRLGVGRYPGRVFAPASARSSSTKATCRCAWRPATPSAIGAIATLSPDIERLTLTNLSLPAPRLDRQRRPPASAGIAAAGAAWHTAAARPSVLAECVGRQPDALLTSRAARRADRGRHPVSGAAVDIDDCTPAPRTTGSAAHHVAIRSALRSGDDDDEAESEPVTRRRCSRRSAGDRPKPARTAVKATLQGWGIDPAGTVLARRLRALPLQLHHAGDDGRACCSCRCAASGCAASTSRRCRLPAATGPSSSG